MTELEKKELVKAQAIVLMAVGAFASLPTSREMDPYHTIVNEVFVDLLGAKNKIDGFIKLNN